MNNVLISFSSIYTLNIEGICLFNSNLSDVSHVIYYCKKKYVKSLLKLKYISCFLIHSHLGFMHPSYLQTNDVLITNYCKVYVYIYIYIYIDYIVQQTTSKKGMCVDLVLLHQKFYSNHPTHNILASIEILLSKQSFSTVYMSMYIL